MSGLRQIHSYWPLSNIQSYIKYRFNCVLYRFKQLKTDIEVYFSFLKDILYLNVVISFSEYKRGIKRNPKSIHSQVF